MPILASHPEKGMRILRGQVTYVQICFLGVRGSAKAFVALEAFQYTLGLLIKITYFSFWNLHMVELDMTGLLVICSTRL